jgi:hypothetical protein
MIAIVIVGEQDAEEVKDRLKGVKVKGKSKKKLEELLADL